MRNIGDPDRRSLAARMAPQRRDAVLARLTEYARRQDASVDALIAATVELIEANERGETGATLVAEVGTRGRIHVKRLRPG